MTDTNDLEKRVLEIRERVSHAEDEAALSALRVEALGKKGANTELLKSLGAMAPEERAQKSPLYNRWKNELTEAIAARETELKAAALNARLSSERVDVTLPADEIPRGSIHPVSQVLAEITAIFGDLGFAIAEGPDVESDDYNFSRLNIPADHPARQMHDTFYMAGGTGTVLRTHTSPVQVRTMLSAKPPIRIIAPGRTYRCDSDATHSPMFHQFEGLVIDEHTHLGHLKWVLEEFCKAFFEVPQVKMRLRPSYFPFTEPSIEVDIQCDRSGGKIRFGTGSDWLEIAGAGMVHPKVLELCNVDPARYQGFAFGMGIDRIAMLKYGIPDLRAFFESDVRWLKHYGFAALDIPSLEGGLTR
jgi:phenylalanyl-tRNA synthetase alpha chain